MLALAGALFIPETPRKNRGSSGDAVEAVA
jgi:hypothetical protein